MQEVSNDIAIEETPENPENFSDFVEGFKKSEPLYYNLLRNNVTLVTFEPGKINLAEKVPLPSGFTGDLIESANKLYQNKWLITIEKAYNNNDDTIEESNDKEIKANLSAFKESDEFKEIRNSFPEAEIVFS